MSSNTNKEEKCTRCGIPKTEWKGRWQDPLCKVGETTYDTHLEKQDVPSPNPLEEWIEKCPRCGGQEFSIPEYICDKCHWQDPVVANPLEEKTYIQKSVMYRQEEVYNQGVADGKLEMVEKIDGAKIIKEERLPYENSPEIYGNKRLEAYKKGYNQALQDIKDTLSNQVGKENEI